MSDIERELGVDRGRLVSWGECDHSECDAQPWVCRQTGVYLSTAMREQCSSN